MSSIPTSAMPHAAPAAEAEPARDEGGRGSLASRAADLVRDHPKTAIAAGAAVAAGVAAATIPLVRSGRGRGEGKSGKSKG